MTELDRCLRELRAANARTPAMRRVARVYDRFVEPVGVTILAAVQLFAALSLLS